MCSMIVRVPNVLSLAPLLDLISLTEVPLPLTHFWGTGPSEPA
jgi:hypothetical protein